MATHVEKSSVRREVHTTRGVALIVTLAPEGIWIREKRKRTSFLMPYGVAHQRAAHIAADAERRAKQEAKKQRKAERKRGRE